MASPKKGKKAAATAVAGPAPRKSKAKPTHPPTSEMVNAAIKALNERGGSSLQAIKKYLTANYQVDIGKLAPHIRMYLKIAAANGKLIQTKGKGASGSFKLPSEKADKKPAAARTKKEIKLPKGASVDDKRAAVEKYLLQHPAAAKPKVVKKAAARPKKEITLWLPKGASVNEKRAAAEKYLLQHPAAAKPKVAKKAAARPKKTITLWLPKGASAAEKRAAAEK